MKNKLKLSVVNIMLFVGLSPLSSQAQSAFAGFYGQISTGYEGNQLGNMSGSSSASPNVNSDLNGSAPSQTFGGAPLVLGAGYYWQANEKWLVGVGADYSALSQTSSNIPINRSNAFGNTSIASGEIATGNGATMQLSNRFNIFVTPGYAIDKDKLVYLKTGYSQVSAQYNRSTSASVMRNGLTTSTAATGGNQTLTQSGYLVGLGYKQIITSGLYGFIEGNYMGYGAPSYSYQTTKPIDTLHGINSNSTKTATNNFSSLNTYQLLIGVGYAF